MKKYLLALFFSCAASFVAPVCASNIAQVAMDSNVPFLLDDEGNVWAFRKPTTFEEPVKISGLNHIKQIAPFIALDDKGRVYVWTFKHVEFDELGFTEATYTEAKQYDNLQGVTSVTRSGTHFFAAIGNSQIVSWEEIFSNKKDTQSSFCAVGYGPMQTIISKNGLKSFSARTRVKVVSGAVVQSWGSVAALFDDGSVIGVGISVSGKPVNERGAGLQGNVLTKSPGAKKVALSANHTVVLTADGVPAFWGECGDTGPLRTPVNQYGQAMPQGRVTGAKTPIDDVVDMVVSDVNDNVLPDFFHKKDGSVWAAYAPVPPGMDTDLPPKNSLPRVT